MGECAQLAQFDEELYKVTGDTWQPAVPSTYAVCISAYCSPRLYLTSNYLEARMMLRSLLAVRHCNLILPWRVIWTACAADLSADYVLLLPVTTLIITSTVLHAVRRRCAVV